MMNKRTRIEMMMLIVMRTRMTGCTGESFAQSGDGDGDVDR